MLKPIARQIGHFGTLWVGVPKIIWRIASNDAVFAQKVTA